MPESPDLQLVESLPSVVFPWPSWTQTLPWLVHLRTRQSATEMCGMIVPWLCWFQDPLTLWRFYHRRAVTHLASKLTSVATCSCRIRQQVTTTILTSSQMDRRQARFGTTTVSRTHFIQILCSQGLQKLVLICSGDPTWYHDRFPMYKQKQLSMLAEQVGLMLSS